MVKDVQTAVALTNAVGGPDDFMRSCAVAWTRADNEVRGFSDHTELMEWVARRGASLALAPPLSS